MDPQDDRLSSISAKSSLRRTHSLNTFYLPSKRMGEYIPVRYTRVSPAWCEKYDLAYDRYSSDSINNASTILKTSLQKSSSHERKSDSITRLPEYFKEKKETNYIVLPKPEHHIEGEKEKLKSSTSESTLLNINKQKLRYSDGYTDVSNWEESKDERQKKLIERWDSLGVLGLVCRLYSERDVIEDTNDDYLEIHDEKKITDKKDTTNKVKPKGKPEKIKIEKKQTIEVSCKCGKSRESKWIAVENDDDDKNERKEICNDDNEDDIDSLVDDDDYYWD